MINAILILLVIPASLFMLLMLHAFFVIKQRTREAKFLVFEKHKAYSDLPDILRKPFRLHLLSTKNPIPFTTPYLRGFACILVLCGRMKSNMPVMSDDSEFMRGGADAIYFLMECSNDD